MIIHKMTGEECNEFLSENNFGRIGCARDNQPYVVPIYFVSDSKHLYCFSTVGQKIDWMRANPLVCVEVDEIINQLEWKSVVVLGEYEELCDTPSFANIRAYAIELLQKRAMWWQPAYVAPGNEASPDLLIPVFYRVRINEITGLRGTPDPLEEVGSTIAGKKPKAKWSIFSRWW